MAIFGGIWMLSLPAVVMLHFMNFKPNLSFVAKDMIGRRIGASVLFRLCWGLPAARIRRNPPQSKDTDIETDKLNAAQHPMGIS